MLYLYYSEVMNEYIVSATENLGNLPVVCTVPVTPGQSAIEAASVVLDTVIRPATEFSVRLG